MFGEETDCLQGSEKTYVKSSMYEHAVYRRSGNRNRLTLIKLLFPEVMNGIREQTVDESS